MIKTFKYWRLYFAVLISLIFCMLIHVKAQNDIVIDLTCKVYASDGGTPVPNALVRVLGLGHTKVSTSKSGPFEDMIEVKTSNSGSATFYVQIDKESGGSIKVEVFYHGVKVGYKDPVAIDPNSVIRYFNVISNITKLKVFIYNKAGSKELKNAKINVKHEGASVGTFKSGEIILTAYNTKYTLDVTFEGVNVGSFEVKIDKLGTKSVSFKVNVADLTIRLMQPPEGSEPLPVYFSVGKTILPGATLIVKHPNGTIIKVFNATSFTWKNKPYGTYSITVKWLDIEVYHDDNVNFEGKEIRIVPHKLHKVNFKILDASGNPLTEAAVYLILNFRGERRIRLPLYPDGTTPFMLLPTGTYKLELRWLNNITLAKDCEVYKSGTYPQRFELYTVTVFVYCKGMGGKPLAHANVTLKTIVGTREVVLGSEKTDSNGKAIFSRIPRSMLMVEVNYKGVKVAELKLSEENFKEDLSIKADVYSISLTITSTSGEPLPHALVKMELWNNTLIKLYTNDKGKVYLGYLPKGNYHIKVYWKKCLVLSQNYTLPSTLTQTGDIVDTLKAEVYNVKVVVYNARDKPLKNVKLYFYNASSGEILRIVDLTNGSGILRLIPRGNYSLKVIYDGLTQTKILTLSGHRKGELKISFKFNVLATIAGKPISPKGLTTIILTIVLSSIAGVVIFRKLVLKRRVFRLIERTPPAQPPYWYEAHPPYPMPQQYTPLPEGYMSSPSSEYLPEMPPYYPPPKRITRRRGILERIKSLFNKAFEE